MHRNMGSSKFEVQIKFSFRENVTSGHFIDLTIQKWLQDPNFHHIFKIYILSLKWANNFNPYKQYTPWKVKISRLIVIRSDISTCIKLKMWFASFEQGQNYCVQFDLYECHCPHEQQSQLPLKLTRIKVLHHKRSEESVSTLIYTSTHLAAFLYVYTCKHVLL